MVHLDLRSIRFNSNQDRKIETYNLIFEVKLHLNFTCGIEGSSLSTSKHYKRWVFHNGMVWVLVRPIKPISK
jgi:hypothetical protein